MPLTVVVGGFFGDCGKGKIISHLALRDKVKIVARGGVGPNAGHTVIHEGVAYRLRQIPSGFIQQGARLLIGPGVLVSPGILLEEVKLTNTRDRLGLDRQVGIIEEKHIDEDTKSAYLKKRIGTTGTGCGPAQQERAKRTLKVGQEVDVLKDFLTDVPLEINEALEKERNILLEGTQGTYLSLYHGTYPYVTSKDITASAICADVGVGPKRVDDVVVVFKAYVTRVGGGPLENELSEKEAKRKGWYEIATVTRRVRRSAPFNFDLARRAIMLNSGTKIALTKLDVVFPKDRAKTKWVELSAEARKFVARVEEEIKTPVAFIGTGPGSHQIIDRTIV
ncbi:MAG: adenylosuccinate synthetase [Nitrososphaeria archaeon]|nr:adenylosuccinate synthetase [Nitrososphaeria archaeon]NIQ33165.1 adenylosuccinate synthetase [Nitrososphaeria archaeon]